MLLFLLIFYIHHDLLKSEEINGAKFNEALIIDKHHQNLLQAKSLMRDLEQRFKETSALEVDNYENYELIFQDNITDILKSRTVKDDQIQITKDPTKPPAEFLPSLKNNPYVPHLGLAPIYIGFHAPPSVMAQPPSPDSSLPVTLKHPELRSYVPHLSPTPIFQGSHAPPSVKAKPPSPDPTPPVTLKHPALRLGHPYPGLILNPRYSIYPGLMTPRSLLSFNRLKYPSHYITRFSYSPSSTRTTSNRPQVLYKEPPLKVHFHDANLHELNTFSPAISPSIILSSKIPRFTTHSRTVDVNAKIWLEEIAPYTRSHKILKDSNDHTVSSQSRGRSTVPAPPRIALARNHRNEAEETGKANIAKLVDEEKYGLPYVTLPETTPEDPKNNSMTIIVGDVLYGNIPVQLTPPPKKPYIDEMAQLNEGYLMFFFIEMCRLISLKNTTVVQTALLHMETIYNQMWNNGEISWIQEPLQTVVSNLLRSQPEINAVKLIQTQCSMMFNMLLERKTVLSPEVNTLIEYAENIFNVQDGERLLNALKDFEDYPKTSKTSYEICDDLLTNLIHPFLREAENQRHYPVLDSINKALLDRFPELSKERHGGTLTEIPIEVRLRNRKRKHHIKKRKRIAPPRQIYMRKYS